MNQKTETAPKKELFGSKPVTIDLEPGVPQVLPKKPLSSREEVRKVFGLGFEGDLRAIVQLAPGVDGTDEPGGELYVFDRGEGSDNAPAPLTTNMRDVNRLIRGRYIVMDAKTIETCRAKVESGERLSTINTGYRSFNHDETITVGREGDFSFTIPQVVSANHLAMGGHVDGSFTVEDLHSTNHTSIVVAEEG